MDNREIDILRLEDIKERLKAIPDGAEIMLGLTDSLKRNELVYGVAMVQNELEQGADISSELDGLEGRLVEFELIYGIHVDPNGYDLETEEAYDPTILPSNALDM